MPSATHEPDLHQEIARHHDDSNSQQKLDQPHLVSRTERVARVKAERCLERQFTYPTPSKSP